MFPGLGPSSTRRTLQHGLQRGSARLEAEGRIVTPLVEQAIHPSIFRDPNYAIYLQQLLAVTCLAVVLERLFQLRRERRRSAVAVAEVAALEADRDILPQLDLIGSYSSDGVSSDDPFTGQSGSFRSAFGDARDQDFPDWSVRLEFAIPIGNQAARSRARRSKLEVERQRRVLHGVALDVTKEVREALRRLTTLSQSIRAATESERLAETNLETEQVKLRVGASTAFEVQSRNQELRQARSRLLRNQLDYRTAESRLLFVQGLLQAPSE